MQRQNRGTASRIIVIKHQYVSFHATCSCTQDAKHFAKVESWAFCLSPQARFSLHRWTMKQVKCQQAPAQSACSSCCYLERVPSPGPKSSRGKVLAQDGLPNAQPEWVIKCCPKPPFANQAGLEVISFRYLVTVHFHERAA